MNETARRYISEIIAILVFFILMFLPAVSRLALDYLWFESLGYAEVFLIEYKTRILLFILFSILTALVLFIIFLSGNKTILKSGNTSVSFWESDFFSQHPKDYIDITPQKEISLTAARLPVYIIIAFFSVITGLVISGSWLTILKYLNKTPFGQMDPVFNNDIAFYVFSLPFYKLLLNYFIVILFLGLLLLAGFYATYNWKLLTRIPLDLRLVLVGFLSVLAAKVYLGRYNILYSETGVVYGAGYIDVTVKQYIPVIISIILVLSALAILAAGWLKYSNTISESKILIGMVAIIFLISILGGITASLLQEFKVRPNELDLEKPFIMDNIMMTNTAYDLSDVMVKQYPITFNLSTDILNDPSIINVRLWDYRPLQTTYQQKQAIRTYYGFNDVDVDRYIINGNKTQVWLSAREIYYDLLPADTWLNRHVKFTHGIGVVMSPGNKIIDQGLPQMYIENIPPSSKIPPLTINQPRIYYGERTDTYIFTGTGREEFDYPSGNTNIVTNYSGTGGIGMGGINKLIVTLALGDFKIFLSPEIDSDSRLHINRNVLDRTELITPYLLVDKDAYVVVNDDGNIYWMLNAFVTTDQYPYSEPLRAGFTRINYIQDSTKAVIDAYNGTITYYIIEDDPLLTTYSKIFPQVFKPMDRMPDSLEQHMRYSPDLFLVQSSIYTDYHMGIPEVFYNKEDKWQMANEKYDDKMITVEPYNVLLNLEGSTDFVMMLPFTPKNKDNMIAWMAVNQDPPRYGEKILYEFSKEELIYGPAQIEALIDQDEDISKDLTLWSQGGSNVIRGNMLVIPIRDSLIYIEPLYISAESQSRIPELKKILVVYKNKVVMADSLEEGIRKVVGDDVTVISPEFATEDKDLTQLLTEALSHYDKAKEYLAVGDLENYGREMKIVDGLLKQLEQTLKEDGSA